MSANDLQKMETNRLKNLDIALSYLCAELGDRAPELPTDFHAKQQLLRALMNVRLPNPVSSRFLKAQDQELAAQRDEKGVVEIKEKGMVLWQGDCTRLKVDAIVNAANSKLLGCFVPLHKCIDNAIHSAAGLQLREECYQLMQRQGYDEETGKAKITKGYNLPASHVIHTVGPIISNGVPTQAQCKQLASCYQSCLELAEKEHLASIAFCCISTGEFGFPQQLAAQIAIQTVREFSCKSLKTIVFNVFTDTDYAIYRELLATNCEDPTAHS